MTLSTEQETKIIQAATKILEDRLTRSDYISSPDTAKNFLKVKLSQQPNEVFAAVWLDNRHGVLEYDELFTGTIDGSAVYPRPVIQRALELNAAAVIFAHQHPSGDTSPSESDKKITNRLIEALKIVDVRVIDHLVVGRDVFSFAEAGLI